MPPRIAIPMPYSGDREYAERAIPQYERAVELAGGEPVRIPLDQTPAEVMKIIERCDAVLLPGSKADINPEVYKGHKHERTAPHDAKRYTVDELLLQDAYNMRKPILGICYGLQSLNVHRSGSLIQHIPDFLPEETRTKVNHSAGRTVSVAHSVEIQGDSKLAEIVSPHPGEPTSERRQHAAHGVSWGFEVAREQAPTGRKNDLLIPVNSSHHQAADIVGDGLRIVARCPNDGIIEALEGTSPDHFVLAVQWHPERSVDKDEPSRAIFRALVEAASARHKQLQGEFEGVR